MSTVAHWIVGSALVAGAAVVGIAAVAPRYQLALNGNHSLPGYLYLIHVGELPVRGEVMAFKVPSHTYYGNWTSWMKIARGIPGDTISVEGRTFFVNGEEVCVAKPTSLSGEPLQLGPIGVLPADMFWVFTPHPDSYDSRYADVGWIPFDHVLGRAGRVF